MDEIELNPIGLIDRAALEFLKSKKLLPSFAYEDVWMHEHAVAFTVAKMLDQDLLAEVKTALEDAITTGSDFNAFKKRLKPYLMSRGWWGEQIMVDPLDEQTKVVQLGSTRRLETIFQTNMATAYAAGQWQRIQSTKSALPYLRYNASAASNPREAHKRYYGLVLPVEHELWDTIYPPNGYGCLCSVTQLTRKQAEKYGISDEPEVEVVEVVNQRTGEVVNIPADITPSFAHNHGDRLGALNALFGDKHGTEALDSLIQSRESWLAKRFSMPDTIKTTTLPAKVSKKELNRLLVDVLDNIAKASEADAAARWQVAHNVKLERYALDNETPPDFYIVDADKPKEEWTTIDFMYTQDPSNLFKVEKFNQYFADTELRWKDHQLNIQKHLAKADIVPLDLRQLNQLNRMKLVAYVLSLPQEQQAKIQFLVSESL